MPIDTSNKSFCMFPWTHVNVDPDGSVRPCCLSTKNLYGTVKSKSMVETLNSSAAKHLRKQMLKGEPISFCNQCYEIEKISNNSLRNFANTRFGKYFDEVIANTDSDGTLTDIKLRYIDIRFSNICNFKCKMCGPHLSSSIAAEQKKTNPWIEIFQRPRNDLSLINEVLDHKDCLEIIYFAGGEPLLTEEHYILLEELIKQNKTDVLLRYSSNSSTVNYKQKDLFDLWKYFDKIEFMASIDHYGERAEYIREGTVWNEIETNIKKISSLSNVDFSIHSVLSIFNYLTLDNFYSYLDSLDLSFKISVFRLVYPTYMNAQNLPDHLKTIGRKKLKLFSNKTMYRNPLLSRFIRDFVAFVDSSPPDPSWIDSFKNNVMNKSDKDFFNVFPELETMFDAD